MVEPLDGSSSHQPATAGMSASNTTLVYVGTYTGRTSRGIYLFRLQTENLDVPQNITLVPLGLAADTQNPSFFDLDLQRRRLFAVNELDRFDGKRSGAVSAFSIDPTSGRLKLLNQRPSMGAGPCHIVLDRERRHALVSNYGGGSVAVFPVNADGTLGAPTAVVQHSGHSVDPDRQTSPHAHCVTLDQANRFAFACDLGLDQVFAYRFDAARGTLTPHTPPSVSLKPGAGPRHMVFRPDGRFAYVANELTSTIAVFAYDANAGALTPVQTVSTLPAHFDGANTVAEIDVHPSGKWVYVSNRGHNSVVLLRSDPDNGTLTYVEEQGTGGRKPRHFGLDPSAAYLAIGNQDSDTVLVCRVDAGNGRLTPSGVFASVPAPACVKFLPPGAAKG